MATRLSSVTTTRVNNTSQLITITQLSTALIAFSNEMVGIKTFSPVCVPDLVCNSWIVSPVSRWIQKLVRIRVRKGRCLKSAHHWSVTAGRNPVLINIHEAVMSLQFGALYICMRFFLLMLKLLRFGYGPAMCYECASAWGRWLFFTTFITERVCHVLLLYVDHLMRVLPVNSVAEWIAYWIRCHSTVKPMSCVGASK